MVAIMYPCVWMTDGLVPWLIQRDTEHHTAPMSEMLLVRKECVMCIIGEGSELGLGDGAVVVVGWQWQFANTLLVAG